MYDEARKAMEQRGYSSISEFIRDVLRVRLYPQLTVNGFTPAFEEEVIRSASEPTEHSVEWNGKGSFTKFVLKHPIKKRHDQRAVHRPIQEKSLQSSHRNAGEWEDSGRTYQTL